MLVCTRFLYPTPLGGPPHKGPMEEVEAEVMQAEARSSIKDSPTPKWRTDPSYNWAKNKRR
jgi:hypothetical protein